MTSLTLKPGVGRIENYAFYECSGLSSVTIPGSVGTIGRYAFYSCAGLKNVVIQDGVTLIGDCAFEECVNLSGITIPDSVVSIGYDILYNSPAQLTCSPGSYAYQYALREGYIKQATGNTQTPAPSQNIWTTAYGGNGNYENLGNGQVAFVSLRNKKVTSASIPNVLKIDGKSYKVTQIKAKAFAGCKKLKKITIYAKSLKKVGKAAFKGIHKKAKIKVPKAKLKAYKKLFKGKGLAKSAKITK